MRSQSAARPYRSAGASGLVLITTATVLILLALGQRGAQAQGQLPLSGNPPPNNQDYGQYAPDEQPGYDQPQYPQQPGYGQQPNYQPRYDYQPGYAPQPQYPNAGPQYAAPQSAPPYGAQGYGENGPPQQTQQPLNTEQLEQLVAPIALYPDTLVAQALAAATYPAQVVDADHWRQAQGNAPPEQIVAGANAQNWDPSVKALTAIPQLLAEMDQNIRWTIALGNAYYNQPQDVLDVVQVMRQRAQAAGNLQSTPQEAVNYDQGYIQLAPVNPEVVYLPAYNPWTVYGDPIQPYRGFSLAGVLGAAGSFFGSSPIRYGLGIAMSAFTNTSWGWLGWGLDWLSHTLLFHNSGYYSRSTTVADWGFPHGGPRAFGRDRGMMNARLPNGRYPNGGYPNNTYRQQGGHTRQGGPGNGYERGGYARNGYNGYDPARGLSYARPALGSPGRYGERQPTAGGYHGYENSYARPSLPSQQAYNRMPAPVARPQQYSRPDTRPGQSYGGSGFYGNRGYEGRPSAGYGYGGSAPAYRGPSSSFAERSPGAYGGRGFEGYSGRAEQFGGGKAPKAPKMDKGFGRSHAEKGGGHFGGGHSGGHGGGHGGGHHR